MENTDKAKNAKVFARNLYKPALLSTLVYLSDLAEHNSAEGINNLRIAIYELKEIQKRQHQLVNLDYAEQLEVLIKEATYYINTNNSLTKEERLEYLGILNILKKNNVKND